MNTILAIRRVVGQSDRQYEGPMKARSLVEILARNDSPEILCNECGQALAVEICVECQSEVRDGYASHVLENTNVDEGMRLQ